jgi:hypothetical protein
MSLISKSARVLANHNHEFSSRNNVTDLSTCYSSETHFGFWARHNPAQARRHLRPLSSEFSPDTRLGMLSLDDVAREIACVEVLESADVRQELLSVLP